MSRFMEERGFSFIEILVTLAILGVLLGIALPSFTASMERKRILGQAEDIYSSLQLGRQLAIASQTVLKVCLLSGAGQCLATGGQEIAVFRDDNNNHWLDAGEQVEVRKIIGALSVSLTAPHGPYLRFKSNGLAKESGHVQVCSRDVKNPFGQRVIVSLNTGRIRLAVDKNRDLIDDLQKVDISCPEK